MSLVAIKVRVLWLSPVNHRSSAIHTQVPPVRVSLKVRVTLTVPSQPRIVSHAYSSTPYIYILYVYMSDDPWLTRDCQSNCDGQGYSDKGVLEYACL